MIKEINFDELKDIYLHLSKVMSKKPIDQGDLLIDYNDKQDASFVRGLELLRDAKELLKQAKLNDDKIAMQAALVYIRVYAMGLSSFFDAFKEDADALLRSSEWPDIPEDYQVPEHYNYPHK
ncbi:Uncharacterised protein [Serratia liquefaciens]|jgi:hypothetical protein|uniref:hypothetical protein n=1 Tax=Serratia liquefaciens TaxID=614 RepID=UPI00165D0384|nr:hypothetical protein [Serratia liquefaciens]MDU5487099.1 hypothetical protein [Serratia liquefaciens]NLU15715.1 hypothetical protein [Serratia liquefaciens]QNQ53958.1 hypothetical protein IAI46_22650 [Serratia liquefaciens]CAI1023370.1 Uncharacterised protein [Serratia liquefaciens]CAI1026246.1 Uncharacterised protein [Serratia liquefaciens]